MPKWSWHHLRSLWPVPARPSDVTSRQCWPRSTFPILIIDPKCPLYFPGSLTQHQTKPKTSLVLQVKGYPHPSIYGKDKGRITCDTNRCHTLYEKVFWVLWCSEMLSGTTQSYLHRNCGCLPVHIQIDSKKYSLWLDWNKSFIASSKANVMQSIKVRKSQAEYYVKAICC